MSNSARVRVYVACSLDGFIAGPGDDLSFLPGPDVDAPDPGEALQFPDFMAQIGAMLMGRRTYDIVTGMGVPWPYGEVPVLVATSRPLEPVAPTVRAVHGPIDQLVDQAIASAVGGDVYLDGGALVQSALNAGRVDEICLSVVPVLLGAGVRLFDNLTCPTEWRFTRHNDLGGGMVQLTVVKR